jgi:hypothetical protein
MTVPGIRIQGTRFVDTAGARFPFVEFDAFALLARWYQRDGPNALVAPWLDALRHLADEGGYHGPIVLRVFRHAGPWNAFVLDPFRPGYMAGLRPFVEFCGARGFYVDLTAGDAQVYFTSQGQIQQHVNEVCAQIVDLPNVFLQTSNEVFKNGIDVDQVRPPQWGTINPLLRDSGAYGEADSWPTNLDLDFIDFHPSRRENWLAETYASAFNLLERRGKAVRIAEAMGFAEEAKPGSRANDPDAAFKLGLLAAFCGIGFHCDDGMSCDGLRPVQRACAVQFFKGVKGGLGL